MRNVSSSICVVAVGTPSALPTLTHEEGDYYIPAREFVAERAAERIPTINGKLGDSCLNSQLFASVAEAQVVLNTWREDYNAVRPPVARVARTVRVYDPQTARAIWKKPAVSNYWGSLSSFTTTLTNPNIQSFNRCPRFWQTTR